MEFGPEVIWSLNILGNEVLITQTVTTTWFIIGLFSLVSIILT